MWESLFVSWKYKQGKRTNVTLQLIDIITSEYVCLAT